MKKSFVILGIAVIVFAGLLFVKRIFFNDSQSEIGPHESIRNFEECLLAGNAVMESYPRQCITKNGIHFIEIIPEATVLQPTENISNASTTDQKEWNKKFDLIRVSSHQPGSFIDPQFPLLIEGEARGYWFFEATFPVFVIDDLGNILGSHYAEAQSEWMTENFVPFRAEVSFKMASTSSSATIVLGKSNASGLPEHDDELRIPVRFLFE